MINKLAIGSAVGFFAFILWIIYLADSGGSSVFFDFVHSFAYGDKLGHFCLFGTLTFLVIAATGFRTFCVGQRRIFWGIALVALFVLGEEISQAFIATRTFDLLDLTADTLAMLLSAGLAQRVSRAQFRSS